MQLDPLGTIARARLDRVSYVRFLATSTLCSFVLLGCIFAPRMVAWTGLEIPGCSTLPEVNRANFVLLQLEDPFVPIENASNRVVRWRILFPLLAHVLHVPRLAFLMLPHVGCLLVLGFLIHLFQRETRDRLLAFLAALLLGTSSWFFVSTGWLTYFDSWYVLGLLLVAFARSRPWLIAACLLVPWIDERFVLGLPLALVARALGPGGDRNRGLKALAVDGAICVGLVAPYVGLRLVSLLSGADAVSAAHLKSLAAENRAPATVAAGLWSGLRGVWALVAAHVWFVGSGRRALVRLLLLCVTAATVLLVLGLAGDFSRATTVLLPTAAAGLLQLGRAFPQAGNRLLLALVALLGFNVVVPVDHVVSSWRLPIRSLPVEIAAFRTPPDEVNPGSHNRRGCELAAQGNWERALVDFNAALALQPRYADAHYHRALLYLKRGETDAAMQDLAAARESCPPDWPKRADVEKRLLELRQSTRR